MAKDTESSEENNPKTPSSGMSSQSSILPSSLENSQEDLPKIISEEQALENKFSEEELNKETSLLNEDYHESEEEAESEEGKEGEEPIKKRTSPQWDEFINRFESEKNTEDKLKSAIDFMRTSLSQSGTPYFKGFWEARKLCLPLFKETITPAIRSQLWKEYMDLTKEGRRLKELLNEESQFAVEQIDIAISGLEKEIHAFHDNKESEIAKITDIELPQSVTLEKNSTTFQNLQKQLNLLNAYAARINGLRKELIKIEIRIRQKNKFFQRLSKLGDLVFPLRKELIREVSDKFLADVNGFVNEYFGERFSKEVAQKNLFRLRDEIKSLQLIAKILTLNTHSFAATRVTLSQSWDQLKGLEKEFKKEQAVLRQKFKQNGEVVHEKIAEFSEQFKEGTISLADGFKQLDSISEMMRGIELGRDEVRALREELKQARQPLLDKSDEQENERRKKDEEATLQRREMIQDLKNSIDDLLEKSLDIDVEQLETAREELLQKVNNLPLTKGEKQNFEKSLRRIKDVVAERRESSLMNLSADERLSLEQLQEILGQRKERRNEVKTQVEEIRKLAGGSGLDFEKAMAYNEIMSAEKERLDKINDAIKEIEQKISELKRKKA